MLLPETHTQVGGRRRNLYGYPPKLDENPPFYGNPDIINILIKMRNNAKADNTIKNTAKALRRLDRDTDLNNPEQVKQYIANMQVSDGYKKAFCVAYNKYCKHYEIQWQMPKYRVHPKL